MLHGGDSIRDFFARVFADMSHHAHLISNFRLAHREEHEATGHAYVTGMGRAKTAWMSSSMRISN